MSIKMRFELCLMTTALAFACGCATAGQRPAVRIENEGTLNSARPVVIGHRGAAGYLPEHTLEGYRLAIDMGADFIEPDLVLTKDHVLIARHENEISGTTDVAEKFPKRKTTKVIDGEKVSGWFSEDFTLKEIKTLRAKERLSFRDHSHDGKFLVPTLEEILQLIARREKDVGRVIGVYPEIKHSTYFSQAGFPMEDLVLRVLARYGYVGKTSPVIIQSAETANLRYLRGKSELRLLQLVGEAEEQPYDRVANGKSFTYADMATARGLKEVATYADGVGPSKTWILPVGSGRHLLPPTSFVKEAHAVGLFVHPYTFRNEPEFLSPDYGNKPEDEYCRFFELGVDGVFSDFADVAVQARRACAKERN